MLKVMNNKIVLTIGSSYTQYPNTKTPAELFGGTWAARHDNEGIFFRTPGGQATPFNGGVQQGGNQSHNHDRGNMEIWGTFGKQKCTWDGNIAVGGAFATQAITNSNTIGDNFYHGGSIINFYASRSWTGVTSSEGLPEARPINRTYRIWECVGV